MKKIITLFSLFTCLHIHAQTFTPEDALQKFVKYPQERIFVKFDKADYLAGETMHFKAYVFSKFKLSLISTNLYFEYLDKGKKIIYNNVIPLYAGIAEGSFTVPKQLTEDVYYFRAYTSWMLNFDEGLQFIKAINIYNPSSSTKLVELPAEWSATVHPEGGTLLDNVESKVAVRLHSQGPLPKKWSGYLFENADPSKNIADITFINEEIGSLDFVPLFGKDYSIKITDDNNRTKMIPLPKIIQQGVSIAITNSAAGIDYSIVSKGITDPLKGYKILAHIQGVVIYSAVIKNSASSVNATIPLDSLTKGIVHITLFDAKGNVAAERLCFATPQITSVNPAVQFTKNSSAQKGLNEWSIDADTTNTHTYTIEVTNDDDNDDDSQNFLTTFWLGELSSQSFKANGYFNPQNPDAANALDILLISEKWGRFEWNKFLNNPVPKLKYIPDNFLTFLGQVLHNNRPVGNEKVGIVIQMPDSAKTYIPVNTDSIGRFIMKDIDFRDTAKAFFRINSLKNAATDIDVTFSRIDDSKSFSGILPPTLYSVAVRKANDSIPQKIKDYVAAFNNTETEDGYKKLAGVVVKGKAKNPTVELNNKLSTALFSEPGEIVFDFINDNKDEAGSGILDWLTGRVPGLTTQGDAPTMRGQAVKIYINENLVDLDRLNSTPVSEIAMVKVLRTPFLLGSSAPVIAVYTKTAGMFKAQQIILKSVAIAGYPTIEKFKIVDYGDGKIGTPEHDTRNVLYWNTVLTPEKNKQVIRFYNNDISKNFRVIIIGFSKTGTPVYLDKEITF